MKLALAVIAAFVAVAAFTPDDSGAFVRYQLKYVQAQNATFEEAKRVCNEVVGCVEYSAGNCVRQSLRRINCIATYFFETGGECTQLVRVGVRAGYVRVITVSESRCY